MGKIDAVGGGPCTCCGLRSGLAVTFGFGFEAGHTRLGARVRLSGVHRHVHVRARMRSV
jgi:hypothetical protein